MIACRNVPRKALPGPGLLLLLPLTIAGCGAGPEAGGEDETLDPASSDGSIGSVEEPPSSPPANAEASSAAQREAPEGGVAGGGEPQEASSSAGPPQQTARTEGLGCERHRLGIARSGSEAGALGPTPRVEYGGVGRASDS